MMQWPEGVRQRVARETTWDDPTGTVSDQTRCGRRKVRPALALQPESFKVTINLRYSEYIIFKNWFRRTLRRGALSFGYPQLDVSGGEIVEYRFVPGSSISYSNTSGRNVKATMEWEEV